MIGTLILITPYVALTISLAMMAKALNLHPVGRRLPTEGGWRRCALFFVAALAMPAMAHAQAVDLRAATESGNAIIMYLSATFAAVGIVAAGVAMMMGRQTVAKWAFVGAMVSGLGFAIVRTMWSSMGLEASGVSTF